GRVGIAAILHARLEPVEFRRGRWHVGIGFPRGAVGLRRGAAEIVGVGGDIAEAAHAWGLRQRRRRGLATARRPAAAVAARPPPERASRARWAASDSTLRTASSSDSRSRVISDSESGGCTLRSWAISAARARSYSARRLSPGALGSSPEIARAISG